MASPILTYESGVPSLDGMLLTLDNQMTAYEREEDDSQALDNITRLIKFYLYTKLQKRLLPGSATCLQSYQINNIYDLYFPLEAGSQSEKKETFRRDLEAFMMDLRRD